jgi:hypothetical protein
MTVKLAGLGSTATGAGGGTSSSSLSVAARKSQGTTLNIFDIFERTKERKNERTKESIQDLTITH